MKIRFFLLISLAPSIFAHSPSDSVSEWCKSQDAGIVSFVSALMSSSKSSSCEKAFLKNQHSAKLELRAPAAEGETSTQKEFDLEPISYFQNLIELSLSCYETSNNKIALSKIRLKHLENLRISSCIATKSDFLQELTSLKVTVRVPTSMLDDLSVVWLACAQENASVPMRYRTCYSGCLVQTTLSNDAAIDHQYLWLDAFGP